MGIPHGCSHAFAPSMGLSSIVNMDHGHVHDHGHTDVVNMDMAMFVTINYATQHKAHGGGDLDSTPSPLWTWWGAHEGTPIGPWESAEPGG